MIIGAKELESLTKKSYPAGSRDAIDQWSDQVDSILREIETLRDHRREEIVKEQTLASARRIIRQTRESALKELSSLANA